MRGARVVLKVSVLCLTALLVATSCASPSMTDRPAASVPTSERTPSPTATPSPTPAPSPVISCSLGPGPECEAAVAAVLAGLPGRSETVTRIEIGSAKFCPTPGLLLASTNCPEGAMPPPDGGRWIGNALVTFAGVATHGYLNIEYKGTTYVADFIALATPVPVAASPVPGVCQAADLRAKTGRQGETGVVHGDVLLTNVGSTACVLNGAPVDVQLIATDGQPLRTELIAPVPTTYQDVTLASGAADAGWLVVYWANWCGVPPGPLRIRIVLPGSAGVLVARFDDALVPRCDAPTAGSTLQTEGLLPNGN